MTRFTVRKDKKEMALEDYKAESVELTEELFKVIQERIKNGLDARTALYSSLYLTCCTVELVEAQAGIPLAITGDYRFRAFAIKFLGDMLQDVVSFVEEVK